MQFSHEFISFVKASVRLPASPSKTKPWSTTNAYNSLQYEQQHSKLSFDRLYNNTTQTITSSVLEVSQTNTTTMRSIAQGPPTTPDWAIFQQHPSWAQRDRTPCGGPCL